MKRATLILTLHARWERRPRREFGVRIRGETPLPQLPSATVADVISNGLRLHLDGTARTFRHADAAALAIVVVEFVALVRPQLDHRVVRAHAVAVVALEA